MQPEEKAALLKRYSDRLTQNGATPAALGWTKPKHKLRYRVLLEYWLSGPVVGQPLRILDFGCGFGDLVGYAQARRLPIDYTGIDINADLIRVARSRYPGARFLCGDLFEQPLSENFDVVVSSGVHNFKIADNHRFVERSFAAFNDMSRLGFAVNFLSTGVNFRNADNYYAAPDELLSMALRYSTRVQLRHDYMPFEFTVFVDKRAAIDEELTVFMPFVPDCAG